MRLLLQIISSFSRNNNFEYQIQTTGNYFYEEKAMKHFLVDKIDTLFKKKLQCVWLKLETI